MPSLCYGAFHKGVKLQSPLINNHQTVFFKIYPFLVGRSETEYLLEHVMLHLPVRGHPLLTGFWNEKLYIYRL
jgi:hypothetical protein